MVLDRSQIEETLKRAFELDAADEASTFDVETLQRLAGEFGVSRAAITQAIVEVTGDHRGATNAVAQSTIPASGAEINQALDSYLRLRGLRPIGSGVWRQESGWWPDLYRFFATTPVAVAVVVADDGTVLRLTAQLDRVWRGHLLAALLAPVLLVLSLLASSSPASDIVTTVTLVVAWVGATAWAYQHRREAIRRRLAAAIADVSRPSYRLQPW